MQKDFIIATPDTGGGNGAINVTASKNTSSERSTSLTISCLLYTSDAADE